ncbi:MAG: hypothetical protein HWE14_00015 [Flavobacteriia bacterium]|nr:hypothetical protein [Flavobacteriia bacterium]
MKIIYFIFLFTLLPLKKGICQHTLNIKIDTSYCNDGSHLEGKFGFYGTTRFGQQIDTLIEPLRFIENQEITIPSDSLTNFRFVFTPSDTTFSEVIAPLYYVKSLDNVVDLDCYFFRKSVSLLDQLENKDTLYITTEYRGVSHAGMTFPRSTLRITRKNNQFYYSRNDLPTHGDLVIPTFPGGKYENGFSEDSLLTENQLNSISLFETEIVNSVAYSYEYGLSEIRITFHGRTYKFISNMNILNPKAHLIWEQLK